MLEFNFTANVESDPEQIYDLIILGGGPAGLTAGLYAARYKMKTLLVEKAVVPGGQLINTQWVENYPGFPEPVLGQKLAQDMEAQAKLFGMELMQENVVSTNLQADPKEVITEQHTWRGRTVLIATGSSPRRLGVEGELEFAGNGVSYCATCDGPFYPDKVVAVVGGGNSAFEEALFISKYARKIIMLHRQENYTADPILQERVAAEDKISRLTFTEVEKIAFTETPRHLLLKDTRNKKTIKLEVDGIFIFAGALANTELFAGQIELVNGYVKSYPDNATSLEGVWVAGDVQEKNLRQVATAVGDGANAAYAIHKYLMHRRD